MFLFGVCGRVYLRLIFKSCHVSNVPLIFCRYLYRVCVSVQNAVRCCVAAVCFAACANATFYGLSYWNYSDLIFQFKICMKTQMPTTTKTLSQTHFPLTHTLVRLSVFLLLLLFSGRYSIKERNELLCTGSISYAWLGKMSKWNERTIK